MRCLLTLSIPLMLACTTDPKPAAVPPPERAAAGPRAPASAHVDEPAHEGLPTQLRLSPMVERDARLRSEPVRREQLAVTLALPGEIAADPDRSARLASPIAGRLESVRFREGSSVKEGDVLAVIAVPDLGRLRTERAAAQAQAKAARAQAERLRGLFAESLASEQEYLDAQATAESLELEARAGSEQLRALGLAGKGGNPAALSLRAPIAGTVVARNAVVGQPVGAQQVLCEIVDLSQLWFLGRVFEKDLGRLALGAAVEVQLNAYPEQRFFGKVEYIGQQVDPVARTVTARVVLENREGLLRVGLFGTAYVSTGAARGEPALVVPRAALTEIAGKQVVFVRQPDGHFELHEVTTGESAAGKVEVLAGLREGEQVVVEGVFTLKSAVLKSTFAEEE